MTLVDMILQRFADGETNATDAIAEFALNDIPYGEDLLHLHFSGLTWGDTPLSYTIQ